MTDSAAKYFQIAYTAHVGLDQGHPTQQDALWNGREVVQSADVPCAALATTRRTTVVAVADGVSLSPAPDQASRVVLDLLAAKISVGARFDVATIRAVQAGLRATLGRGRTRGASTTLVAAAFTTNSRTSTAACTVLSSGDSRAYLIPVAGTMRRLTRDHNVRETLIERGEAPEDYDPRYLRALDSCLSADGSDPEFRIHEATAQLRPGDGVLLCTDGVHACLGEEVLARLTDAAASTTDQVESWRRAVLAAGAPDNFSMILVRFVAEP